MIVTCCCTKQLTMFLKISEGGIALFLVAGLTAAFIAKAAAWPTAQASGDGRPQTTRDHSESSTNPITNETELRFVSCVLPILPRMCFSHLFMFFQDKSNFLPSTTTINATTDESERDCLHIFSTRTSVISCVKRFHVTIAKVVSEMLLSQSFNIRVLLNRVYLEF